MKLADILKVIKKIVNESRLVFDKESLKITAMDPANVSMVILDYKLKTNIEGSYGINLLGLCLIFKHFEKNKDPEIEIFKVPGSRPEYDITKLKIRNGNKFFNLNTFQIEEKEPKIPDLKFKAEATFRSSNLKKIIDAAYDVSESIVIHEGGMSAKGDLLEFGCEMVMFPAKAKYSLEYLQKMILEDEGIDIKLEWSDDYPLRITYEEVGKYKLQFILAPRGE